MKIIALLCTAGISVATLYLSAQLRLHGLDCGAFLALGTVLALAIQFTALDLARTAADPDDPLDENEKPTDL